MSKFDLKEQAFPGMVCVGHDIDDKPIYRHPQGMTLRDYFAGQALAGLVAITGSRGIGNGPGDLAARSYELADAMLAERAKDGQS